MPIEITVPRLGWSMDEGTFADWLKREGEFVNKGEMLFVLEGDKAAQEIECFDEGILKFLPGGPQPGDKVQVGQLLAYLLAAGETVPSSSSLVPVLPIEEPATSSSLAPVLQEKGRDEGASVPVAHSRQASPSPSSQPHASPRARRRAKELGVEWTTITGSGSTGRIRERDVVAAAGTPNSNGAQPLSTIRRIIAERMSASHLGTAPVTLTTTADATNLVALRRQFQTAASGSPALVPSYTDFLAKLTALALAAHPDLNARWESGGIVTLAEVHMGLAVDTPAGLVVPVVRNVERLSLRNIAQRAQHLVERARTGRLSADELQGGTFTITNLGAFGIDAFTPIINAPQCAILGLGRILKQPVYQDNQFVPRDVLTLSLTFDHRVVDGAPAARFLQTLVRGIESPAERLIE